MKNFLLHGALALLMFVPTALVQENNSSAKQPLELIEVSKDGRRFVLSKSGAEFRPWGFNYDHDRDHRLLETYWKNEWKTVVSDFQEMKQLGANIVRIHLQVSHFMKSAKEPNRESLKQLSRLLELAEKTGLYLDVTGLGCYDRKEVPEWFNQLSEEERWETQARFWEAVAKTCRNSPAVFCYDLMNEPIVTEDKKGRDWTLGEFGGFCFVQRLILDLNGRKPKEIAEAWVNKMVVAIRKHDQRRLVTVGAIPWAMTFKNATPLFYSPEASRKLDFVSVHFYPKKGEVAEALKALKVYDIGKPVVIEEMFPLNCSLAELDQFIDGSRSVANGWIGFYWGKTIEEYEAGKKGIGEAVTQEWLKYFKRKAPEILSVEAKPRSDFDNKSK